MWFIVAHRYQCRPDQARVTPLMCDSTLEVGRKAGGPLAAHVNSDKSISKHQFELAVAHNDPTDLSLQLDVLPTSPALHVLDRSGKATTLLEDKPIKTPDTPVRIQHVRSCVRAGKRGATFTLIWVPVVLVVDSAVLSKDHLDTIDSAAHMLGLKVAMDHWDAQATHVIVRPDAQLTPVQTLAIQLGAIPVDPSWVLTLASHTDPVDMDEPDDIVPALQATFFRVQPSRKVNPNSLMKKPLNGQALVLDTSMTSTLSDPHRTALCAILTHLGVRAIMDADPANQLPSAGFLTLSALAHPIPDLGQPVCSLDTFLNAVASGMDIPTCFTRPLQQQSGSSFTSSFPKTTHTNLGSSLLRSQGSSVPHSSPFGLTPGGLLSGVSLRTSGGITQGGLLSGNTAKTTGTGGQSLLFGSLGSGTSLSALIANKDRSQPFASSLFSAGASSNSANQFAKPSAGTFGKSQLPAATQQKQIQSSLASSLLDQIGKAGSLSELGLHVPKKPALAQPDADSPLSDLQETPSPGPLSPLTTGCEEREDDGSQQESDQSQRHRGLDQPKQDSNTKHGTSGSVQEESRAQSQSQGDKTADLTPGSESAVSGGLASVTIVKLVTSTFTGPGRMRATSVMRSDPLNVKPFRKRWPLSPPESLDDVSPQPNPVPRLHITVRVTDNSLADQLQLQGSMGTSPKRHASFASSTISTPPRAERTRFMTLDDDSNSDDEPPIGAYVVPPTPSSPPLSLRNSVPPSPQVTRSKRRRRLMDSDDDEQDELLEATMAEERPAAIVDVGSFGKERGVRKRRKLLDSP